MDAKIFPKSPRIFTCSDFSGEFVKKMNVTCFIGSKL